MKESQRNKIEGDKHTETEWMNEWKKNIYTQPHDWKFNLCARSDHNSCTCTCTCTLQLKKSWIDLKMS